VIGDPEAVSSNAGKAGEPFESAVLFVNGRAITSSHLGLLTAARYRDLDRIRAEGRGAGQWNARDEAVWNAVRANAWRQALRSVVFGELLRTEAEAFRKLGMDVSERQVEERWRQMLKDAGGPGELARLRGLSVAALKELARDELLGDAYRHTLRLQLARPTPGELREFYQFGSENFRRPESVKARAVVIRRFLYDDQGGRSPRAGAAGRAREALDRLAAGEDFAKLVAKYSEEPASAAQGGMLGDPKKDFLIERGAYEPELEKVLFGAEPGSPAQLVEGRANCYVIQVLKHFAAGVPPFEEVEDEVFLRCYSDRVRKAEEKLFRESFGKVLVRDASGRRIGVEEFFAEPTESRKRSLFDRAEEPAEPEAPKVPDAPSEQPKSSEPSSAPADAAERPDPS
jgi:hypothetical protein